MLSRSKSRLDLESRSRFQISLTFFNLVRDLPLKKCTIVDKAIIAPPPPPPPHTHTHTFFDYYSATFNDILARNVAHFVHRLHLCLFLSLSVFYSQLYTLLFEQRKTKFIYFFFNCGGGGGEVTIVKPILG